MNVLIAKNSPDKLKEMLSKRGYNVLYGTESKNVQYPVRYHIDMQIVYAGNKTYVCAPELYGYYRELLKNTDLNIIAGDTYLKPEYPYECAYNVCVLKDFAIANFDVCDSKVKDVLIKNSYKLINVKQAYAKCSIAYLGDNAVITADKGIIKALKNTDISVCETGEGGVFLEGYDWGFIGGASGSNDNTIYFCGDITVHKDYEKIKKFAHKFNKEIVYSENILTDVGTILFLA